LGKKKITRREENCSRISVGIENGLRSKLTEGKGGEYLGKIMTHQAKGKRDGPEAGRVGDVEIERVASYCRDANRKREKGYSRNALEKYQTLRRPKKPGAESG